jgi:Skp family chaperone for outer membrane proteins
MQLKKVVTYLVLGIVVLTGVILIGNFSRNTISAAAKAPDSTVGYVDMERIQKEHPDFINLAAVLKDKEAELNFFKSYLNKQLDGITRDLRSKMDQEKTGKTAEEQTKIEQKYQEQFQVKSSELNNQLGQKSNEISEYVNQQKGAMLDKLKKVIETVATDMKLTLVLDKSARLYGGVDITQAVLDKAKADSKTNPKTGK